VTKLATILHVAAGTVALLAGIIAMSSRKGACVHWAAGTLFCGSMLGMAVLADYLAVAIPEQMSNFFIGTFTIHLVATAWMTVRRKQRSVGVPEKTALNSSVPLRAFRDSELSGGDRIEAFLFVPQLSSLGMLIFWIIRVRFTGGYKDLAPN
jgi:uncharacterized membrane protein YfcA